MGSSRAVALHASLLRFALHGAVLELRHEHEQRRAALRRRGVHLVWVTLHQAQRAPPSAAEVREELIDQLVQEVQERQDFLEAMQRGGRGAQYEHQIKAEVSERLNRLRELGLG